MHSSKLEAYPRSEQFLSYFLRRSNVTLEGLRERLSAELQAADALLSHEKDEVLDTREINYQLNIKNFKKIHSNKEELLLLLLLRLVVIALEDKDFNFIFWEAKNLISKRNPSLRRTVQFFNFSELPEKDFLFELEKLLEKKEERLTLIRILTTKREKKEREYRLYSIVFQEFLSIKFRFLNKPEPQKLVRHKGYRDHGSLRQSNFTRPDQDRTTTTWEEDREKEANSERNAILDFYESIGFLPD